MVAIKLEETFQVQAPADRVWSYLTDPRQVVGCLPGAELVEVRDDGTFVGRIKVKVGPVTAAYKGSARFQELDVAARLARIAGEGQETAGSGSAKMTMSSRVSELPDGGSEVRVEVEMDVVGRIVQFGRGMIEEVSRQLFRQFASCVQAELGRSADAAQGTAPAAAPASAPAAAASAAAVAEAAPVNGLQLLLRALLAWGRRLFRSQSAG
jgi:carbon monoxide dehydrogenase subunit G